MGSQSLIGKYQRLLKLILLFGVLVGFDQFTKGLISEPILNHGFFLGSFSWSSSFYRIFCTAALLSLAGLSIILIQFLTAKSFPELTWILTLFQAGLFGNGIDKIRLGAVRDFIPIRIFNPDLILNIADFYLWIAAILILFFIWKDPAKIWPKENLRKKLFAYPKSQSKIVWVLLMISLFVSIGNYILMMAYLKETGAQFAFFELSICFLLFSILILSLIFIFGVYWSNQIYGPFRAIGRSLESGHPDSVKLRQSDENECVQEILELLKKRQKNNSQA